MDAHTIYELIGYLSSALIAISLMMKRILYLRVVNLVGAITFTIYGLLIGAYPIVITNAVITLIDVYFLYKIFTAQEFFRLLELPPDDRYLHEFLAYYADDIETYVPGFEHNPAANELGLLVLRDMVATGVLIGYQDGDCFHIALDYVIPGYRDFKSGRFIFRDSRQLFAARGIQRLVTTTRRPIHARYLERVGFTVAPQQDATTDATRYTMRV